MEKLESIIAEKFQTVIARGILNSRMKDYYDLYYLITYKDFSKKNLKNAITKTFEKRETSIDDIDKVIEEIKNADFLRDLWRNYSTHYQYANDIEFNQVINAIEKINTFIK